VPYGRLPFPGARVIRDKDLGEWGRGKRGGTLYVSDMIDVIIWASCGPNKEGRGSYDLAPGLLVTAELQGARNLRSDSSASGSESESWKALLRVVVQASSRSCQRKGLRKRKEGQTIDSKVKCNLKAA
jgi:hypothetical protein